MQLALCKQNWGTIHISALAQRSGRLPLNHQANTLKMCSEDLTSTEMLILRPTPEIPIQEV